MTFLFLWGFINQARALSPELNAEIQRRSVEGGEIVAAGDNDFKLAAVRAAQVLKMGVALPLDAGRMIKRLAQEFADSADNTTMDPGNLDLAIYQFYLAFEQKRSLSKFIQSSPKASAVFGEQELYDPAKDNLYLEKMRDLGLANDYLKIKVRDARPKAKKALIADLEAAVATVKRKNLRQLEEVRRELFREILSSLFRLRTLDFLLDENTVTSTLPSTEEFLERAEGCFFSKGKALELHNCASRLAEEASFWIGRSYLKLKTASMAKLNDPILSMDLERKALSYYDHCSKNWYFDHLSLAYSGRHSFNGRAFAKTCLKTAVMQIQYLWEKERLKRDFSPFFEAADLERQVASHLDVLVQCAEKGRILKNFERQNDELKFSWESINKMSGFDFNKKILSCELLFEEEIAKYLFPRMLLKEAILEQWVSDKKERVRLVQESIQSTLPACLAGQREQGRIQSNLCFPLLQLRMDQLIFDFLLRSRIGQLAQLYFSTRSDTIMEKVQQFLKEELRPCQEKEIKAASIFGHTSPSHSSCAPSTLIKVSTYLLQAKTAEALTEEGQKKLAQLWENNLSKAMARNAPFSTAIIALREKLGELPLAFLQIWAVNEIMRELKVSVDKAGLMLASILPPGLAAELSSAAVEGNVMDQLVPVMVRVWEHIAQAHIQEHVTARFQQKGQDFQRELQGLTLQDFKNCIKDFSWPNQSGVRCMQALGTSLLKHGHEQSSLDDLAAHFIPPPWFPVTLQGLFAEAQGRVEKSWRAHLKQCPPTAARNVGLKDEFKLWGKSKTTDCQDEGKFLLAKELSKEIGRLHLRYLADEKNPPLQNALMEKFPGLIEQQISLENAGRQTHWSLIKRLYLYQGTLDGVAALDPYKDSAYLKQVGLSLFLCLMSFPESEGEERRGPQLARQNTYVKKCVEKLPLDPGTIDKDKFIRDAQIYNSCLHESAGQGQVLAKRFDDCRKHPNFHK